MKRWLRHHQRSLLVLSYVVVVLIVTTLFKVPPTPALGYWWNKDRSNESLKVTPHMLDWAEEYCDTKGPHHTLIQIMQTDRHFIFFSSQKQLEEQLPDPASFSRMLHTEAFTITTDPLHQREILIFSEDGLFEGKEFWRELQCSHANPNRPQSCDSGVYRYVPCSYSTG